MAALYKQGVRVQIGAAPLSALSACPTPFHLVVLYEQQLVVINRLNKKARPACIPAAQCAATAPIRRCRRRSDREQTSRSRKNPSAFARAPTLLRGTGDGRMGRKGLGLVL
jgi:hypothetical protein